METFMVVSPTGRFVASAIERTMLMMDIALGNMQKEL
jgi:hypothetical protein